MLLKSFFFAAVFAAAFGSVGRATAEPLAIKLPSHVIGAPSASFPAIPGGLLGTWHDGPCLLLPPGITPFETVSDTLVFHSDGTFTQTIEKATGTLHSQGSYTVTGTRLTLEFGLGAHAMQYEFSRAGDRLLLQPVGRGKAAAWTLQRVGARD